MHSPFPESFVREASDACDGAAALWALAGGDRSIPIKIELAGCRYVFTVFQTWIGATCSSWDAPNSLETVTLLRDLLIDRIPRFREHPLRLMRRGTRWCLALGRLPKALSQRYRQHEIDGGVTVVKDMCDTFGCNIEVTLFDGTLFTITWLDAEHWLRDGTMIRLL